MRFRNRIHAGNLLAEKLSHLSQKKPLILALPRGGVPVAAEIARRLNSDLDILLVNKIGIPQQPEVALGAVSEDGKPLWKKKYVDYFGLTKSDLFELARPKIRQLKENAAKWRIGRPPESIEGRTVIVVDDGLATGATMKAALRIVKSRGAKHIAVALPVTTAEGLEAILSEADEVAVLSQPEVFNSVSAAYDDFTEVGDDEVSYILGHYKSYKPTPVHAVEIVDGNMLLNGDYFAPEKIKAVIVFAHGSGSSRKSPRNRTVAEILQRRGFATLLFDLLTVDEASDHRNIFDIDLLARRLAIATNWVRRHLHHHIEPIGYFGASTGAAAALKAAAKDNDIYAVVSRGGRPDLAGENLFTVTSPTLLIVGSHDPDVLELNERAKERLPNAKLIVVSEAGHLFEEPGALEEVAGYAADWFEKNLDVTPILNINSAEIY